MANVDQWGAATTAKSAAKYASLTTLFFAAMLSQAHAVHTWNNPVGGLYSNPDNWIGGVPVPGQQVIYDKSNTYPIDVDILADNGSVQFAASATANVTLNITGAGYTIGQLKIGQSVAGSNNRVYVQGASFDPTDLELAPGINGRGSLTISVPMHAGFIAVGGQISRGGQLDQTPGGAGTLTLNAGANVTTNSVMGYKAGAGSSIVFNGGTFTILGDGRFNSDQATTFTQVGDGTHTAELNLRNSSLSPGQYDFASQALTLRALATVNYDSPGGNLTVGNIVRTGGALNWIAGSINLTNAALQVSPTGQLGSDINLDADHNLTVGGATNLALGSSLMVAGGSFHTSELTNSGGSISYFSGSFTVDNDEVEIGLAGITNFAVTIPEGSSLAVPNNALTIGLGRFLTVSGGSLVAGNVVNHGIFGFDHGSVEIVSGDLTVGPYGMLNNNTLLLDVAGGSSLHVPSGTLALQLTQSMTVSGGDVVAKTITNSGSLEVSGGALNAGRIYVGNLSGRFIVSNQGNVSASGIVADQMTVSGGSVFVSPPNIENPPGPADAALDGSLVVGYGRSGELTINEGFVAAPSVKVGPSAGFAGKATINGGTLATDNLLAASGARSTLVFNGGVIQSGHSEIDGDGPFKIGNGVDAAVFQMNGGTHRFADGLELSASGSLAGAGTILGDVIGGGVLSPGQSPGLLTVSGNLQLRAENTLAMELGGQATGAEYDQISVSGAAQLGGKLAVSFVNDFVPVVGDSFQLLTYASRAGQFSSLELPALDGAAWSLNYGATSLTLSLKSASQVVGDMDNDLDVDRTDAALFAHYLGTPAAATWSTGDFDGDGATTLADLALLQANLGQSGARFAGAAAVPEPGAFTLANLGLIGLLLHRQRRPARYSR